jgi:hypothetical protein
MAWASSSLPVPVSPSSRTVEAVFGAPFVRQFLMRAGQLLLQLFVFLDQGAQILGAVEQHETDGPDQRAVGPEQRQAGDDEGPIPKLHDVQGHRLPGFDDAAQQAFRDDVFNRLAARVAGKTQQGLVLLIHPGDAGVAVDRDGADAHAFQMLEQGMNGALPQRFKIDDVVHATLPNRTDCCCRGADVRCIAAYFLNNFRRQHSSPSMRAKGRRASMHGARAYPASGRHR